MPDNIEHLQVRGYVGLPNIYRHECMSVVKCMHVIHVIIIHVMMFFLYFHKFHILLF